jgi:hypothetical protein
MPRSGINFVTVDFLSAPSLGSRVQNRPPIGHQFKPCRSLILEAFKPIHDLAQGAKRKRWLLCPQVAGTSGGVIMSRSGFSILISILILFMAPQALAQGLSVKDDPLVRMPGTQPNTGVVLESPNRCLNCHGGYDSATEPGFNWMGSMMAQAARDFLFWPTMVVAGQDVIWATGGPGVGNANATDFCLRCHLPKGWLEGRSEPTNASAMIGSDHDGVQCDFCHRMYDPFFAETHAGLREGSDWTGYWDEATANPQDAADATRAADRAESEAITKFSGAPFYAADDLPESEDYTEATSAQYFVSRGSEKRASFADATARHQMLYSRFHKSKYFCATCHDISNPVLANLPFAGTPPGDGVTTLTTEAQSAHSYFHVERTFSEFMLSDYGQDGGALGKGPFAPESYETSQPNNAIAMCQDCHMRDVYGRGANKRDAVWRPDQSADHPNSGQPLHDLTGGNVFHALVLASAVPGSPNYDATNEALLNQGPDALTMDLTQGLPLNAEAMLAGAERAREQLRLAATIENVNYNASSGALSFRIQNNTGHKLISGYPEGRRMFINVRAFDGGGALIYEVNPYDDAAHTLKDLDYDDYVTGELPAPRELGANEVYADELVYEMHGQSALTGEDHTFHFALSTHAYKDNRIPPKGFRIEDAAARLSVPHWDGSAAPGLYSAAEYAGGYDDVALTLPAGAAGVEINLYYQTTSREYIEFLRNEINGTAGHLTLPPVPCDPAQPCDPDDPVASNYIVQSDPFFAKLAAWGDTVWQLWLNNKELEGAAPFLMAQATVGATGGGCTAPTPNLQSATPGNQQVALAWSDAHGADPDVVGYSLYYDQAGKSQLIEDLGLVTAYVDTGLSNGQTYCYKVSTRYSACQSAFSNILCTVPNAAGQLDAGVEDLESGVYQTTGKGKNKVITFVATSSLERGAGVVLRAHVEDGTGNPVSGATVTFEISGPEGATLTTGPSDVGGAVETVWQTEAPNKKGNGGTAPGSYTATTTSVSADGYDWDGEGTAVSFSLQ